jgi:streptogramin lyase
VIEYALPSQPGSPINIAAGPDGSLWYTKGGTLGRVTPQGVITEFPAGEGTRAVGLSAGADREPPRRLLNRLYFADGARDRLGYMEFK